MGIKILIDTYDEIYAKNLARILPLKNTIFKPITDSEKDFHLVISDKASYKSDEFIKSLIYLCHDSFEVDQESSLYIYAGLEALADKIYNRWENLNDKKSYIFSKGTAKLICITSGAGGVGTTAISLALGRELALNYKKKVLYISMEKIPNLNIYINDLGGQSTINEYLYYCFIDNKSNKRPLNEKFLIDEFSQFKIMRPGKKTNELISLNIDEFQVFIGNLLGSFDFEFVIFDVSGDIDMLSSDFLYLFQKTLLIDDGLPSSIYKNKKWIEKYKPEKEKILNITNKWSECIKEECLYDSENRIFIEYDTSSFEIADKHIDIKLSRAFGIGIRRIAYELTKKL